MMSEIRAWAAKGARQPLEPYTYDPGPLGADEVEVAVEYCGICHSDLSVVNNEWGMSAYPAVPGHEAVGRVVALGANAKGLSIGQRVGVATPSIDALYGLTRLVGRVHGLYPP